MDTGDKPAVPAPDEPAYRAELQIALDELSHARAALRWLEQRYFVLVEALEEGIVLLDENGRINAANPSARMLIGEDDAVRHWLWGINPDEHVNGLHPATETLLDGRPRTGIEMPVIGPDGQTRWLNVNARAVFDMDTGQVVAVLCSFSDISGHKSLELELQQQAAVDPLTGLYNRRYIERRLHEEMNRARRAGQPLSLAMIDIDHFKEVNDRYGHVGGDRALKAFADMLPLGLRAHDLIARLGGDEFCVVLPNAGATRAAAAIERCLKFVSQTEVQIEDQRFHIAGSAGVAELTPQMTLEQLMHTADQVLYAAKQGGRDRVIVAT
jgi:diguanylate cyclase (GGDEF)-like protein/PAS domain S-box-containing protein